MDPEASKNTVSDPKSTGNKFQKRKNKQRKARNANNLFITINQETANLSR